MSGVGKTVKTITATGGTLDGLFTGRAWGSTISYAFPTSSGSYTAGYGSNEPLNGFSPINSAMQRAARFALDTSDGNSANDGFSLEGFTNISVGAGSTSNSTIRIAESTVPSTAWGYYPSTTAEGGDIWFGKTYDYRAPEAGNYAWHTMLHEIGHTLGLKHGQDPYNSFPALPTNWDTMEYTVMTYRSYVGASVNGGYTNEQFGYAQTYMMLDIAALQRMYGADFTTNSGNTVYKWNPNSGDTLVNGQVAVDAGGNRIFATIWDGGGVDTYDLSSYTTNLSINLSPGSFSVFSAVQLAGLGNGFFARGNIFNALQYRGDLRSLIENAIGGTGNDTIIGNDANNTLRGNNGNDRLSGRNGNDSLLGGHGNDRLDGGDGNDTLNGGTGADTLIGGAGTDTASYAGATRGVVASLATPSINTNDASGDLYSSIEHLIGSSYGDRLIGDAGANRINGGLGDDRLTGGAGADDFVFAKGYGRDTITDFQNNIDDIDLRSYDFSSFSQVRSRAFQVGDNVEIRLGGSDVIVISKFKIASLDASDFLL